ncbi:MAG: ABC transporter permease [Candidatus Hodarchaeales archaeon]
MVLFMDVFIRCIKQTLRSPAHLALILAFPIVFAGAFAFIYGVPTVDERASYTVAVVNNDVMDSSWEANFSQYVDIDRELIFEQGFGEYFTSTLENETTLSVIDTLFRIMNYTDINEALEQVRSRTVTLCIVIPENFSRGIIAGINYKINLTEGSPVVPSFEGGNVTLDIYGDSSFQTFQELQTAVSDAMEQFTSYFYGIDIPGGLLGTRSTDVSSIEFTNFDYYIPGFLVFAVLLGSAGISFIIAGEQSHGTLDRLKVSNIKPVEYLAGLTLSQFVSLSVQVVVMLFAAYLFGFNGKGNPLFAFIIGSMTVIPVLGMGMIIASLDKTGKNAPGIAAILSAPMGFISGAFMPLPKVVLISDFIPRGTGGFRDLLLWDLFPFTHAVSAEKKILMYQYDLLQLWPEILLLLIGGILIFIIGALLFTWRLFKE